MSKKVALLVTASFRTRVVVEVPDDWDENKEGDLWFEGDAITDEIADDVATKAEEGFRTCMSCGLYDNIDEVTNDTELPYGSLKWD